MADALQTLHRFRKLLVDEAKCHLAAVLATESTARAQADEADAQIGHEGEIAADLGADDNAVEAFAAWLPIGRAKAALARVRHERSLLDVACARAGLNAALVAAEAAESYLQLRQTERRTSENRRNQLADDEVALQKALGKP